MQKRNREEERYEGQPYPRTCDIPFLIGSLHQPRMDVVGRSSEILTSNKYNPGNSIYASMDSLRTWKVTSYPKFTVASFHTPVSLLTLLSLAQSFEENKTDKGY